MFVEEEQRSGDESQVKWAQRAFYVILYAILWLVHGLHRSLAHLFNRILLTLETLLGRSGLMHKGLILPPHIALSGSIANLQENIISCVRLMISKGTRDITLHDPLHQFDVDYLTTLLENGTDHHTTWSITEIRETETRTRFVRMPQNLTERNSSSNHAEYIEGEADFRLTVAQAGTGRGAIARAARELGMSQKAKHCQLTPEDVISWLDRDESKCMLPSEPDVVVVFPAEATTSLPILNEFPVWQMRLTQIRFSQHPISSLPQDTFLRMVTDGASIPKRFGT